MLQDLSNICTALSHLCKADNEHKLTTSVLPLAEVTSLSSTALTFEQEGGVRPQLHSFRTRGEVEGGVTATS